MLIGKFVISSMYITFNEIGREFIIELLPNNKYKLLASDEYLFIISMICSLQNDNNQDDEGEVFFWDPPSAKNRNSKNQNHVRQLQEQLVQATMKIRDLEAEVKRIQKVKYSMHTNLILLIKFLSLLAN